MKASTLTPGDVFDGKYVIRRVLGEGGMGVVYEALHTKLDQPVALKLMLPEMLNEPTLVHRFEREARAAAKLRSRYVARVFDVDATPEGLPYIVMELLQGRDLAQLLAAERQLAVGQAVHILMQVCVAIHEAHRAGIVHRDLKPANVFLASTGDRVVAKVLDFGISKDLVANTRLTNEHGVVGTVLYMAPEQVRNESVDQRSDIWALGAVLYEILAGVPPFDGPVTKVAAAIVSEQPRPLREVRPDLPAAVENVVSKMLAKDPRERYPDVRALMEALVPFSPSQSLEPYIDDAANPNSRAPMASGELGGGTIDTGDTIDARDRVIAPRVETAAGMATEPLLPRRGRSKAPLLATVLVGAIGLGALAFITQRPPRAVSRDPAFSSMAPPPATPAPSDSAPAPTEPASSKAPALAAKAPAAAAAEDAGANATAVPQAPRSNKKSSASFLHLENDQPSRRNGAAVPSMTIRSAHVLATLALLLAMTRPAHSADEDARATALRAEGNRLMDQRKYEDAIARFEEALLLTPNEPALFYNLARVHDVRGDAVRALDYIERFLARASPDLKAKIPQLDTLVLGMRKRVTKLRVVCSAPRATAQSAALERALILANKQLLATGCKTHDVKVLAGRATLRVEAEGFIGQSIDVVLPGGESKEIELDLAPRDTSGLLRLRSEPEHVTVRLGGRVLGQTPLEFVLAAGSHKLELSQVGYNDVSLPIVIEANKTRELAARLERTASIFTRWWFWTGVAVVAAAGIGVGVALTTERDPDRGTIPPGVTRLPLYGF